MAYYQPVNPDFWFTKVVLGVYHFIVSSSPWGHASSCWAPLTLPDILSDTVKTVSLFMWEGIYIGPPPFRARVVLLDVHASLHIISWVHTSGNWGRVRQLAHTYPANEPEVRLGAVLILLKMYLSCPKYEILKTHKDLLLVPKITAQPQRLYCMERNYSWKDLIMVGSTEFMIHKVDKQPPSVTTSDLHPSLVNCLKSSVLMVRYSQRIIFLIFGSQAK